MKKRVIFLTVSIVLLLVFPGTAQQIHQGKDSIVRRIIYHDTIVYRFDTVRIVHYVHSDTAFLPAKAPVIVTEVRKKHAINPNNWGIGPSVGVYYSPFHGADINFGFGIQYYFLAVPSFRNPHMGHRKRK